jgi:Tol biopolymer transport system component
MIGVTAVAAVALQLVNVSSHEMQADGHSIHADISGNGRLVVFDSLATNLSAAPLQRPDDQEVYLRDRRRGVTRLVSRSSRGRVSNGWSWQPSLSPNGRFVAFCSTASNLSRPDRLPRVPHFGPGLDPRTDVFVRDLRRRITRRASSDWRGGMANAGSCRPSVANTGDVAFESEASDLVRGDRNGFIETFVYDWSSRRVRAAAVPTGGRRSAGSAGAAISPDGRFVAFYTGAHLASADTDALSDVYLRDRRRGVTRVASPGAVGCYNPPVLALTPRAGYVLHWCEDGLRVLDPRSGRVRNATPTLDGRPPDRTISEAGVSADGRTVVFCSEAYNLSRSDGLGDDVYVWHRAAGIPTVVSNAGSCVWSADVSADGRTAVFTADMPGLVAQDVRDVRQSDAFTAGPLR